MRTFPPWQSFDSRCIIVPKAKDEEHVETIEERNVLNISKIFAF